MSSEPKQPHAASRLIDWPAVWRECDRRLPSLDQLAPLHMVVIAEVVDEQLATKLPDRSQEDV